jgi:hypothetical protein
MQSYWETVKAKKLAAEGGAPSPKESTPNVLPGLPPSLEASLQAAQKQGAAGLKAWLKSYRPYVTDPRLAAIELDYIVLLGAGNVTECRAAASGIGERHFRRLVERVAECDLEFRNRLARPLVAAEVPPPVVPDVGVVGHRAAAGRVGRRAYRPRCIPDAA